MTAKITPFAALFFFVMEEEVEKCQVGKKDADGNDFQVYFEGKSLLYELSRSQIAEPEEIKQSNYQKGSQEPRNQTCV